MLTSLTLLLLAGAGAGAQNQDPAQDPAQDPPTGSPEAPGTTASAEELRSDIHDMRMNLLLGGEHVQRAEREAIDFYGGKADLIDGRLDTLQSELSAKRATYDVTLDRALRSTNGQVRSQAMREAGILRAEITGLEQESEQLSGKRADVGRLVSAIEGRDRDRQRLVAQLETSTDFHEFGLPLTSIGLAPPPQPVAAASPFEDDALIADLMRRDPVAARGLLFDMDPVRYWKRFPLHPPAGPLAEALTFPLPDLPGQR
jgi:hypothetical protein